MSNIQTLLTEYGRLAHYSDLSPAQRQAKRTLMLQHIALFRRLRDASRGGSDAYFRYTDLAKDCVQQFVLVSKIIRADAKGELP